MDLVFNMNLLGSAIQRSPWQHHQQQPKDVFQKL
jgi:hypothetical protein